MAAISASLVKELRERTGLGMMDCKKALAKADGNIDTAIEDLRKTSGMKAAKKAGRIAAEGAVSVKIDESNTYGVLLEVNSETDFAAREENFKGFVNKVVQTAFDGKITDITELVAGDIEAAREALVQKIGENISVRRITAESSDVVGGYVHANSRIGVLVALKGGDVALAKDIAMHVAAVNPLYLSPDNVPEDAINKEKEILTAQAQDSGKPPEIIEKMIGGRIRKYLAEISLSEQPFVKDADITIGALVKKAGAELVSFVRYEVGEGIEKDEKDFAEEVAEQLKQQ